MPYDRTKKILTLRSAQKSISNNDYYLSINFHQPTKKTALYFFLLLHYYTSSTIEQTCLQLPQLSKLVNELEDINKAIKIKINKKLDSNNYINEYLYTIVEYLNNHEEIHYKIINLCYLQKNNLIHKKYDQLDLNLEEVRDILTLLSIPHIYHNQGFQLSSFTIIFFSVYTIKILININQQNLYNINNTKSKLNLQINNNHQSYPSFKNKYPQIINKNIDSNHSKKHNQHSNKAKDSHLNKNKLYHSNKAKDCYHSKKTIQCPHQGKAKDSQKPKKERKSHHQTTKHHKQQKTAHQNKTEQLNQKNKTKNTNNCLLGDDGALQSSKAHTAQSSKHTKLSKQTGKSQNKFENKLWRQDSFINKLLLFDEANIDDQWMNRKQMQNRSFMMQHSQSLRIDYSYPSMKYIRYPIEQQNYPQPLFVQRNSLNNVKVIMNGTLVRNRTQTANNINQK